MKKVVVIVLSLLVSILLVPTMFLFDVKQKDSRGLNIVAAGTYNIIKTSPVNGSFSVPLSAASGTTVTIAAITPDAGFTISKVDVWAFVDDQWGGTIVGLEVKGSGNSRTFVMPEYDINVTVSFQSSTTYPIIKMGAKGGGFSVPTTASPGSTVNITNITPTTGYLVGPNSVIVRKGNGDMTIPVSGSGSSRQFVMPADSVSITVWFLDATIPFTISEYHNTGGSVSVASQAVANSTVSIVISPNPNYKVNSVEVRSSQANIPVSGSGNTRTFIMPADDVTVDVRFVVDNDYQFSITKIPPVNGSFSVASSAKAGTMVTISSIAPATNYQIDKVTVISTVDNQPVIVTGTGSSRNFMMPASDVTVSVDFIGPLYFINTAPKINGTYDIPLFAASGETVTISSISANSGYSVGNITVTRNDNNQLVEVKGSGSSRTFVMPACGVYVEVTFTANTYSITKIPPVNGSFVVPVSANYNNSILISEINPNPGYSLGTISVTRDDNGQAVTLYGSGNSRSFYMPTSSVTVKITFIVNTYAITKNTASNGSYSVQSSATTGSTVLISAIKANSGYSLGSVNVVRDDNGLAVEISGSGESRTFTMPPSNVTISVHFVTTPYTITKIPASKGSYTVKETAYEGETVYITAISPISGYSIDKVKVYRNDNGQAVTVYGSGNSRFFTMPKSGVSVGVDFSPNSYPITKSMPSNGSFVVPVSGAYESTITISSIVANPGYKIDLVKVSRNDNGQLLSLNGAGASRNFVMPACGVSVSVSFIARGNEPIVDVNLPFVAEINSGKRVKVYFVAPSDATYTFESSLAGSLDPKAYKNVSGSVSYDDNSGRGKNYKFSQTLAAGEIFSFYSGVYNDRKSANGTYRVTVTYLRPVVKISAVKFTNLTLTYGEDLNADGYKIYRANSKNGTYKLIATTADTTYIDSGLTNNKNYFYKVRSYRFDLSNAKVIHSSYSTVKSAKTKTLKKPSLKVAFESYDSLKINIGSLDGEATGYQIYRASSKNGKYSFVSNLVGRTNYLDSNLTFNKKYYYKVRAYKIIDEVSIYSEYSTIDYATTKLNQPVITSVEEISAKTCSIDWLAIAGAEGYELYRYDDTSKVWVKIKSFSANDLSYTDEALKSGRSYQYKLRVYRMSAGKKVFSSYSSVVKVTIRTP